MLNLSRAPCDFSRANFGVFCHGDFLKNTGTFSKIDTGKSKSVTGKKKTLDTGSCFNCPSREIVSLSSGSTRLLEALDDSRRPLPSCTLIAASPIARKAVICAIVASGTSSSTLDGEISTISANLHNTPGFSSGKTRATPAKSKYANRLRFGCSGD